MEDGPKKDLKSVAEELERVGVSQEDIGSMRILSEMPSFEEFSKMRQMEELADTEQENVEKSHKEQKEFLKVEREVGAEFLARTSFQERHNIVESSFNRERAEGERLYGGKSAVRRNYAYLNRLEKLIDKHGNEFEQRLWERSLRDLIIKPEDFSESFWRREEDRRTASLEPEERAHVTKEVQDAQKRSLAEWSNYLGSEECPFPLWFKIYAWDGMSKMGTYDAERGVYRRRQADTTATYPMLNEAALMQTYNALEKKGENDKALDELVEDGNFNKIYSKFITEKINNFKNIELPDSPEEVKGKWLEYGPDQKDALFAAASQTYQWCIGQDYGTLDSYLQFGDYPSYLNDEKREAARKKIEEQGENKSRFILFHLTDNESGETLSIPQVSIRLGIDGRVEEISGIEDNGEGAQTIADVLVPEVERVVMSLPGGDRWQKAFKVRKQLIDIKRRLEAGSELTLEDDEFLCKQHGTGRMRRVHAERMHPSIGRYGFFEDNIDFRELRAHEKEKWADRLRDRRDWKLGTASSVLNFLEMLGPDDAAEYIDEDFFEKRGAGQNNISYSSANRTLLRGKYGGWQILADKLLKAGSPLSLMYADLNYEQADMRSAEDMITQMQRDGVSLEAMAMSDARHGFKLCSMDEWTQKYGVESGVLFDREDRKRIEELKNALLEEDRSYYNRVAMSAFLDLKARYKDGKETQHLDEFLEVFSAPGYPFALTEFGADVNRALEKTTRYIDGLSDSEQDEERWTAFAYFDRFKQAVQEQGGLEKANDVLKVIPPNMIRAELPFLEWLGIDATLIAEKMPPLDVNANIEHLYDNGASPEILAEKSVGSLMLATGDIMALRETGVDMKSMAEGIKSFYGNDAEKAKAGLKQLMELANSLVDIM